MTTPKEPVILAAQFDLCVCRWSVAAIDQAAAVDPLVQSAPLDLDSCRAGSLEERTSFLRHRIAGALQRGSDRLWGTRRRTELFAIEFATANSAVDGELIERVADHFCGWMVRPPVVCLQHTPGEPLSLLASNADAPDQQRIATGLTAMRPLTQQPEHWDQLPARPADRSPS